MRTRLVAAIAVAALALGALAVSLLALAYSGVMNPPDDSGSYVAPFVQPTETATPTPAPAQTDAPLPTESEIPDDWPESEKQNALDWLAMQGFVDQCMLDAGFPEYTYAAYWQVGPGEHVDWMTFIAEDRQADAFLAEYGNTGAGADYHWEDAGCAGYGTHMIGADNAN